MNSPILEAIYKRRSIREYTDEPVEADDLREIIKAGTWAPSGLNNQPWRFVTITKDSVRAEIAKLTKYGHIVKKAPALIAVYLDKDKMYDNVKDHQSAGACIQNMLLAAEALDLGAVWLGQILLHKKEVNTALKLAENFDLMAVLAVGHPLHDQQSSTRKELDSFIINEL